MSEFCEKLEEKLKEVMTSERGNFRCIYQSRFRRRAERGSEPVKRRKYPLDHPGKWKQPVSQ